MSHSNILDPQTAALIVIDVQEAFRNAVPDFAITAGRVAAAVQGFQILGVPVCVTEQYPKGLGRTAAEIKSVLSDSPELYEKTVFSSCGADAFVDKLNAVGITQTVICGLETHICVSQTAHDLIDHGFQVHVLCDCVTSRFEYNRLAGLAKMRRSGVIECSTEMALFELMRDAKHEKFKEIQNLIK